jgi:hypothetical protein
VPVATPETIPEPVPTVATDVLLLLHIPPGLASVKEVVDPTQTEVIPVIGAAAELMVIVFVAGVVPHKLVTV